MAEAVLAAPPAEPPPDAAPEGAHAVPEDVDSLPEGADAVAQDVIEAVHEGADELLSAGEPLPEGGEVRICGYGGVTPLRRSIRRRLGDVRRCAIRSGADLRSK